MAEQRFASYFLIENFHLRGIFKHGESFFKIWCILYCWNQNLKGFVWEGGKILFLDRAFIILYQYFFKASLSLIDYVWVHCTTYLSKVSETVFLKINPASVQLAVIFKTLWPLALFHNLSKEKVSYLDIWKWKKGGLTEHNNIFVMTIVRISIMLKCYFSDFQQNYVYQDKW